jgi:membrane protease subunit (stomatin/prohibitin family)
VAAGDPALEEQVASLLADKKGLFRMLEEFNSCMKSNSQLKREVKQLRAAIAASAAPSWACAGCGNDNFPKFCSRCGTPCGAYKPDLPSTRYKNLTDSGEIVTGAVSEEEESPCPPGAVDAAQPPRRRRHTVAVEAAGGGL